MPGRPIDTIKIVVEYLRQQTNAAEQISEAQLVSAFRLLVVRERRQIADYINIMQENEIISQVKPGAFSVNWTKVYMW